MQYSRSRPHTVREGTATSRYSTAVLYAVLLFYTGGKKKKKLTANVQPSFDPARVHEPVGAASPPTRERLDGGAHGGCGGCVAVHFAQASSAEPALATIMIEKSKNQQTNKLTKKKKK